MRTFFILLLTLLAVAAWPVAVAVSLVALVGLWAGRGHEKGEHDESSFK